MSFLNLEYNLAVNKKYFIKENLELMRKRLYVPTLALGFLGILNEPTLAQSIAINNSSFETPELANSNFTNNNIPDWELFPSRPNFGVGVVNPGDLLFPVPVPDGENTAYINNGSFSQTLAETLISDSIYTLSAFVGDRQERNLSPFTVNLLAGGNLLAQGTEADVSIPNGEFALLEISFDSTGSAFLGQPLEIEFSAESPSGNFQVNFDDVTLVVSSTPTSVPEPSTILGLVTIGGIVLGASKNKKSKQDS